MSWEDYPFLVIVMLTSLLGGALGYFAAGALDDIESCTDVERLRRVIDDGRAAEQRIIELLEVNDDAGH
jgi:hypothetical protein